MSTLRLPRSTARRCVFVSSSVLLVHPFHSLPCQPATASQTRVLLHLPSSQVKFADGSTRDFDYILLATGYTSGQGTRGFQTAVRRAPSPLLTGRLSLGPHTKFLEKKITDKLLNEYKVINSGVEVCCRATRSAPFFLCGPCAQLLAAHALTDAGAGAPLLCRPQRLSRTCRRLC